HVPGIDFVQATLTIVGRKKGTAVEAVDEDLTAFDVVVFQQKVAGHSNAEKKKTESAGDFHVDEGKGDGEAQAAIKDVIEKRVAGIVVVVTISAQAGFLEQHAVEGGNGQGRAVDGQ